MLAGRQVAACLWLRSIRLVQCQKRCVVLTASRCNERYAFQWPPYRSCSDMAITNSSDCHMPKRRKSIHSLLIVVRYLVPGQKRKNNCRLFLSVVAAAVIANIRLQSDAVESICQFLPLNAFGPEGTYHTVCTLNMLSFMHSFLSLAECIPFHVVSIFLMLKHTQHISILVGSW